jgi:hypothetical protein
MSTTPHDAPEQTTKRGKVVFDPTVNLGHILTFLGFMVAGSVAYHDLKEAQAVQNVRVEMLAREFEAEKSRTGNAVLEIKSDMKEIRRGVDQLRERKP